MTWDGGFYEQEQVLARAQKYLVGGRVYDSLPEEMALELDDDRKIKPYVVLTFGPVIPTGIDGTLGGGEADQPHVMSAVFECYASAQVSARATAAAVRRTFVGWAPSQNADQMRARGGAFRTRVSGGLTSRYLQTVNFEAEINLGDVADPTPEDTDPRV